MNRKKITALACHIVACLFFPLAVTLGFKTYVAVLGDPFSRGAALGLAVQFIFAAFVLVNVSIALVENLSAKIYIAAVLVVSILAYLLPQHPWRALFLVLRGLWGKSELTVREAGKLAVAKHTLHLSLLSPCILLILPRSGQAMTPLPAVHPPTTPF